MDVKDFREANSLISKDIVSALREHYRGYDKMLHSKVERPDIYGIKLIDAAEKLLQEQFATKAPEPRREDKHRVKARVSARLTKTLYGRLQQAQKRDGFSTMQDELTHIIKRYCDEQERKEK